MRAFALCLCLASPALAEEWQALDDAGIKTALEARVLQYEDGSLQDFFQDGRTLYQAGAGESWGKWWAEGGKYCSTWPPSEVPSCYGVEAKGLQVQFIDSRGKATVGHYVDLN